MAQVALGEPEYVGTVALPEKYPQWVNTPDKQKRWDLSHDVASAFFGTDRTDPTVLFYARLLYTSDFPTELPGDERFARAA